MRGWQFWAALGADFSSTMGSVLSGPVSVFTDASRNHHGEFFDW